MREHPTKTTGKPENGDLVRALRAKWEIREDDPRGNEAFAQKLETVLRRDELVQGLGKEIGYSGDVEGLREEMRLIRTQAEAGKNVAEKKLEKKGFFRRLWEKVKGFPRKHPIVTAILALAAIAGVGAAIAYYAGSLELLFHKAGEKTTKLFGDALKKMPIDPGTVTPGPATIFGFE